MSNITAIITAYRRPQNILPLVEAVRSQSVSAAAVWCWANDPTEKMKTLLAEAKLERVVTSSENALFHGRFALALLARTEFVAIFDDDSIPGEKWFANCLETMDKWPGILGTAGVVLHEPGYAKRTMHGWQRPSDETVEVDLVGQAWFLRTEWVKFLFSSAAVTGTNGEDIELAARAWRLAGIRSFCPPHPARDKSRWGSTRGLELGIDEVAASLRVEHLAERKRIVEAEMSLGWKPMFVRNAVVVRDSSLPPPDKETRGQGDTEKFVHAETTCAPSWSTQYAYSLDRDGQPTRPARVTLRLEADDADRCLRCVHKIESLGADGIDCDRSQPQYDRIECGAALERVRDPLVFLRRARRLLKPGGELIASVANARRESVIRELLHGRWHAERDGEREGRRDGAKEVGANSSMTPPHPGPLPKGEGERGGPLRFFTRRELEKLFYRAGFVSPVISPSLPPSVSPPPAPFISGLPHDEAQEFNTERHDITATAEPRRDYGLTSIVIVTHNELACTHACLASIRFVTDERYELIVVDNGSTDGTVDYLRSCPDVKLIANSDNRGFPAAANQGIRASSGKRVLLLNNDVLVTTGWLRRMLEAIEGTGNRTEGRENPKSKILNPKSPVGLVGPLTNCASGYQEIEISYTNLACLDGFAWEHAKKHAGQLLEVDRLIGFCLLIRREVIDQVGLFDERFGIGNFEDDDYCRRASDAGWRLVVAQDAFIHHFGHRSFEAAGVDLNALLEKNKRLYDEKWMEGTGHRPKKIENPPLSVP